MSLCPREMFGSRLQTGHCLPTDGLVALLVLQLAVAHSDKVREVSGCR